MNILLAVLLGGLFGFALYFAGASNYKNIIAMLRFDNLKLMKIILFAIGFASVLIAFAYLIGIFNTSHISIKATHLGVITGGLIFGLGFGVAGACPGTCMAGFGGGFLKKALAAIIGGLIGTFIFSITYGFWAETGLFDIMGFGKVSLFKLSDKFPSVFNIGYAGLLITGCLFMILGYIIPEKVKKELN